MSVNSGREVGESTLIDLRERYGLHGDPFADAPGRFFSGGDRQHCLDALGHFCSFGDSAILVTGEPGSGRSRLLAEFVHRESAQFKFHQLQVSDCGSVAQLALTLARVLGPSSSSTGSDPTESIAAFFSSEQWQGHRGKRWVLLMDSADQLSLEVLQALAQGFAAGNRVQAPLPLLVCGPQRARKLQQGYDTQPPAFHLLALRPLSEDESGQFIGQCFEWAGGDLSGALDLRRVRQLHEISGGNFSRLKQVAPEVLLGSSRAVAKPGPVMGNRRRQASGLILALLLLGISYGLVSWQYQGPDEVLADRSPAQPLPDTQAEVARVRQAMDAAERRMRPLNGKGQVEEKAKSAEFAQVPGQQAAPLPGTPPLLPDSLGLPLLDVPVSEPEPIGAALPDSPPAVAAPELKLEGAHEPGGESAGFVPEYLLGKSLPEAPEAPEPFETADTAEAPASPKPFAPVSVELFRDAAWLEAIQPDKQTVQILGSYDERAAVRVIQANPGIELFYVRSLYKGRPWFVVLYGIFEDRAEARSALAGLPAQLRGSGPWVRDIGGV